MTDPRLHAALDRIDHALSRLEAAKPADPSLGQRHEKLRQATQAAITGLDRMIAEAPR